MPLTAVVLRRKVGSGEWTNVSRTSYSYYAPGAAYGAPADLQTVTTQVWRENQWQDTGTTLYRYYLALTESSSSSSSASSSSSSSAASAAHLLRYVVGPAAYDRLVQDPNVSDPLTASDFLISQYADFYYEYDSNRRVTKEIVQGGSRTFTFSYAESGFSEGYNRWKYKTVETLPGGDQNIVYSNYTGQTMLKVFQSGSDQWCEFWKYDSNASSTLYAKPSAVSGYDESSDSRSTKNVDKTHASRASGS